MASKEELGDVFSQIAEKKSNGKPAKKPSKAVKKKKTAPKPKKKAVRSKTPPVEKETPITPQQEEYTSEELAKMEAEHTKDIPETTDIPKTLEKANQEEVVEGHQTEEYNITDICLGCSVVKNNICVGTGRCFECEVVAEPKGKSKLAEQIDQDLADAKEQGKKAAALTIKEQLDDEAEEEAEEEVDEVPEEIQRFSDEVEASIVKEEKPKPPKPKRRAPPPPGKGKKKILRKSAPQVTEKDVKKDEPPKRKKIKREKDDDEQIVSPGIISESKLRRVLGRDVIEFSDAFDEEIVEDRQTICIVGKGKRGKSTLALSGERGMFDKDNAPTFDCDHEEPTIGCDACRPTIIYAITMDDKTGKPAKALRSKSKIIHVLRGMSHYREQTDTLRLMTSSLTKNYINDILSRQIVEHCKKNYKVDKPDFVLIDDLQILQKIMENAMRESFGFGVYDKFDWKSWERRNQYVNEVHRLSNILCKEALFYCTYEKWDDKEKEDGTTVSFKKPAWAGDIEKKTDTLIEVTFYEGEEMKFMAQVKSAKDTFWSYMKTRVTVDYKGNGGLWNLLSDAPEGRQYDVGIPNA